jgi:hypothetical protein
MKALLLFFLILLLSASGLAQTTPGPIEDNSFLIEEAYNQEPHVVQYIKTFYLQRNGDWAYSFTNEYPIKTQRHQFSYTINVGHVGDRTRLGDTYINYRYQIMGIKEGSKVAVAPRFSLILPTGSWRRGTGSGALGYQLNVPVSVKLSDKIVTHWNAGATVIPNGRNLIGDHATTTGFNLGQSTIYLASNRFNVMFETYWLRTQNVIGRGITSPSYTLLLNPGIRWAYNFTNGLQIVPGIAAPTGIGPSWGQHGVFLYLSFEK